MRIEFDAAKDQANIAKHGVSLGRAADFVTAAVLLDNRFGYGETRFRALGHIDGVLHCLVYTYRGQIVRVISLRRAREKEKKLYGLK